MAIGFFCKSFRDDLPLLRYSLELLALNWIGARPEVVVVLDEDCRQLIREWRFEWPRYEFIEPWPDKYCHAMAIKCCADLFMRESDPIFLLDSDTMLTERSSAPRLMPGSKPVLIYQKWLDRDQVNPTAQTVWVPTVARCLGLRLSADWMVHPERLYWKSTFTLVRDLVEHHKKAPFLQAVHSAAPYDWHRFGSHPMTLCENEMLPMIGAMLEAPRYDVRRLEDSHFSAGFQQLWSHSPLEVTLIESWLMQARDRNLDEASNERHHARPPASGQLPPGTPASQASAILS